MFMLKIPSAQSIYSVKSFFCISLIMFIIRSIDESICVSGAACVLSVVSLHSPYSFLHDGNKQSFLPSHIKILCIDIRSSLAVKFFLQLLSAFPDLILQIFVLLC